MSATTELNREIVQEGLTKRKSVKREQEQKHEDMRRAMFDKINDHCDAANRQREKEAALAEREAAEERSRKEIRSLYGVRNRGLLRVYGALAYTAIAGVLYAVDGIKLWVAIAAQVICIVVAVRELIKACKQTKVIGLVSEKG